MNQLPSATEREICYWCNDCMKFTPPDRQHDGRYRNHGIYGPLGIQGSDLYWPKIKVRSK